MKGIRVATNCKKKFLEDGHRLKDYQQGKNGNAIENGHSAKGSITIELLEGSLSTESNHSGAV